MKTRIVPIAKKEFLHILRDWRTLMMAIALPLVLVLLFGWAITFDIRNITLAIHDGDQSPESRRLLDRFTANGYFKLVGNAENEEALGGYLDRSQAQIALSIPEGYARGLQRGEKVELALLIDGAESNTATIAGGYIERILTEENLRVALSTLSRQGLSKPPDLPPIEPQTRYWYNAELRSQNYIVPGLIASIMMVMTALLTSLTIISERERGSMEQLLATPVRVHEILLGKLIPYLVIGVLDSLMIVVVGFLIFDVPFVGSGPLFFLSVLIFAMAGLGIGLTISAVAKSQVMAMQMALLLTMLPSFLLSGFMFAIKNMPDWVQAITYLVPARYFLVVLRGIFLKDQGLDLIWPQLAFLGVLAVVMLALAHKKFKRKVG
jgi:drug efflux transport system permease protein